MDVLFDGIPLGDVTTSMTISGPAVPVFCMYLVAAERQGVDPGAAQRHAADRHLQGVHRAEGVAVPAGAAPAPDRRPDGVLRARDARATSRCRCPATTSARPARPPRRSWRSPSPTASATSSSACRRGLDVDVFAPGLSFFFDAHIDFFEEIAKFRAARRIWARWLRDVYGANDRQGAVAALPHPDRRRLADRAAAGQQRRPHRGRGARRGARRHELAAHQRARRGARAAERAGRARSRCAPSRC